MSSKKTITIIRKSAKKVLQKAIRIIGTHGYILRDYQKDGVKWMIHQELKTKYKSGILADDPGLGKTVQTAALMIALPKKTLIIVPTAVITQWKDIMVQIFGESAIYLHYGADKKKTQQEIIDLNFNVCITSHGSFVSRKKKIYKTILHIPDFWKRIVVDEGHVVRNKKTKMYKTAMNYSEIANSKWILSGTPVQNKKTDIINILSFLGMSIYNIKKNLKSCISKYLLRRTKELLMDDTFEDYSFNTHIIPFDTREEQHIYSKIEENSLEELADLKDLGISPLAYLMKLLEIMVRLRQASSHPQIAINSMKKKYGDDIEFSDFNSNSTKICRVVQDICSAEGFSLVFCHFIDEMNMIQEKLIEKGFDPKMYNGSMSRDSRDSVLQSFKRETTTSRILIIQIMAGGVGLNLQQFSNVFIVSPNWNPTNEIQAISRAHRYGQLKKVKVHKYILKYNKSFISPDNKIDLESTTLDERILNLQKKKRNLMVDLLEDPTLQFREIINCNRISIENYESIINSS